MADEVIVEQPETGGAGNDGKTTPDVKVSPDGKTPDVKSGTPPVQKGADDSRERGILADLQKERKARQDLETRLTELSGKLSTEQKRVMALAGLNPDSPEEADTKAIRARLAQVIPGLDKLTDQNVLDKLLSLVDRADSLEEATTHHWTQHGAQMLGSLVKGVADHLGGELTERQASRLKRDYIAAAEADPEFLRRHEAGDPNLIKEFVASFVEDWFEPARRKVTQQEAARLRNVPSGRDRTLAASGGKKIDYNNPKSVEDALVASFKQHGGEFGE